MADHGRARVFDSRWNSRQPCGVSVRLLRLLSARLLITHAHLPCFPRRQRDDDDGHARAVCDAPAAEKHTFQAETKQLLNIVANALYTDKHVFIRCVPTTR
jgi:phosphatidylserine/phosphatidylglycerophosphate/cardiolipin synthase-like enzyme